MSQSHNVPDKTASLATVTTEAFGLSSPKVTHSQTRQLACLTVSRAGSVCPRVTKSQTKQLAWAGRYGTLGHNGTALRIHTNQL